MATRKSSNKVELNQLAKETADKLNKDELEVVTVSPQYAAEFGDVMPVSINGVSVYVPCDGREYKVPKTYAELIKERIRAVDRKLRKMQRMGDVSKNLERSPGELRLF